MTVLSVGIDKGSCSMIRVLLSHRSVHFIYEFILNMGLTLYDPSAPNEA